MDNTPIHHPVPALIAFLVILYRICLIIYRTKFHPLSRFPGPVLAASTSLYSHYFNFIRGGNFIRQLEYLHDTYGPIVRTHPNELHIRDIEAFDTVFKVGSRFEKDPRFYGFPFEGSHFNMVTLKQAKPRRDLLQPQLSRRAINRAQNILEMSVWKFIDLLECRRAKGQTIDLSLAYRCVTADMFLGYAFNRPLEALNCPDFKYSPAMHMDAALVASFLAKNFRFSFTLLWKVDCKKMILDLRKRKENDEIMHPTMLDTLIDPAEKQLGPSLSISTLTAEAIVLLFAGAEATSLTLILGTFHISKDRNMLTKLQDELSKVMIDKRTLPSLDILRGLPYLTGVIKEALRFSHGAPGKLPRITPDEGATLCGQWIPPKTPVSLSHWVYHYDSRVFSDPGAFNPERWINDQNGDLDRHLLSFSKGSRSCIGINLAYAELYLLFASFFRNYRPTLNGTNDQDMEVRDYYAPMCKGHLRIVIDE
ncbi:uncharacterized protein TRIVIDRAFT_193209 [Trichoderma virens Gv29-8]|uniref:Cytochrome P450 n=1 Tax=Hypocrea virens (strain Gv29-8 / FGSC 10586) TaxID=413071 RepID=G9N060_HYPVG|nr:uncharacterized protein TRIVIDRAFT_193209 [Trichoderma virens Gv29-8]EHK19742.1 hypothetical protein TRIVIDRAFT_193209 [Trichoderma virens Gv29-8]